MSSVSPVKGFARKETIRKKQNFLSQIGNLNKSNNNLKAEDEKKGFKVGEC